MAYISLLRDFAVVISSVRGFILASVRLFLQMLNGREYKNQSHFKPSILLIHIHCATILFVMVAQKSMQVWLLISLPSTLYNTVGPQGRAASTGFTLTLSREVLTQG